MKNLLQQSILIVILTVFGWSNISNAQTYNVQQLFSESWTFSELSAMTYDSVSDNLFYIKSTTIVPHEVHRYNFGTSQITTVYSYNGQWDYGARVLNGDLYVVRSYDNSILRLTNLSANTLTNVNIYPDSTSFNAPLTEIEDISLVNGNIYFVCGNMVTSNQHNGIQYLQGPDFTSVNELLSSGNAGWPDSSYVYNRSLISIGSGVSAKFVITTSYNGNIELRDVSGNLIKSDMGYGDSYLQKDSQDRIYAITGSGTNTKITRWSSSLNNREEFLLNFSQYNGYNGIRFILKESGSNIDVIMTQYRATSPVFYRTTIPNATSSINQIQNNEKFSVYPNPTNGQFTIVLPTDNATITVTNLFGQQILKTQAIQKTTNLQLNNNGVYIVYVTTKQGTTTRKLVVNR